MQTDGGEFVVVLDVLLFISVKRKKEKENYKMSEFKNKTKTK